MKPGKFKTSLSEGRPDLALEWLYDLNDGYTPSTIGVASRYVASWQCIDGHEIFKAPVWYRTSNKNLRNCLECESKTISKEGDDWLTNYIKLPKGEKYREVLLELNDGRNFKADGFNPETNTVYEYHGSRFHGPHPKAQRLSSYVTRGGTKTPEELYQDTIKKEQDILDAGFRLEVIWDFQWKKLKKTLDRPIKYCYYEE